MEAILIIVNFLFCATTAVMIVYLLSVVNDYAGLWLRLGLIVAPCGALISGFLLFYQETSFLYIFSTACFTGGDLLLMSWVIWFHRTRLQKWHGKL